jgi:uncharacterized RDD family membrane protein YckC
MSTPPPAPPGPPSGYGTPPWHGDPGPAGEPAWSPGWSAGTAPPGAPYPGVPHPGAGYPSPPGHPGAGYPGPGVYFPPPPLYARPGGHPLAEATDRLLARIVDGLILSVPMLLIELPVMVALWYWLLDRVSVPTSATGDGPLDGGDLLLVAGVFFGVFAVLILLNGLFSYLYEVVYMHRTGQTVGKRLMRLRVVTMDVAAPIDVGHARRRWLAREGVALLALIPFVGSLAGVYNWLDSLWLLWDKPNRQCLHDKYARTVVIKLPPAAPATGVVPR